MRNMNMEAEEAQEVDEEDSELGLSFFELPLAFNSPRHLQPVLGVDLIMQVGGEYVAGVECNELFTADMENEGEDEDSFCSSGDLSECRSGPTRCDQDTTLCQAGVLG